MGSVPRMSPSLPAADTVRVERPRTFRSHDNDKVGAGSLKEPAPCSRGRDDPRHSSDVLVGQTDTVAGTVPVALQALAVVGLLAAGAAVVMVLVAPRCCPTNRTRCGNARRVERNVAAGRGRRDAVGQVQVRGADRGLAVREREVARRRCWPRRSDRGSSCSRRSARRSRAAEPLRTYRRRGRSSSRGCRCRRSREPRHRCCRCGRRCRDV